jgi:hypothetical protein
MAGKKLSKGIDSGPPTNPRIGLLYYDTMTGTLRMWDGTKWAEKTHDEIRANISKRAKAIANNINRKGRE